MHFNKLLVAMTVSAGLLEVVVAGGHGHGSPQDFTTKQLKKHDQNGNNNNNSGNNGANAANASSAAASANTDATAGNSTAQTAQQSGNGNTGGNTGNTGGNNAASLSLNTAAVQTGSESNGAQASGSEAGQANSLTDNANFINFCTQGGGSSQKGVLTNGLQVKGGSCNGIVMGDVPASTNMVSSIITNPQPGQDLQPSQTFNISVQMNNLAAGSFTNPDATYYAAPQQLKGGNIVGHTHVTVQDLGGTLTPSAAPDATKFAFFKGINDAGNGQGLLSATVTGGLPAGSYRVCTLAAASNHQPVLMPVAQRGGQDDCTKFTVGQGSAPGAQTEAEANATNTAAAAAGGAGGAAGNAQAGQAAGTAQNAQAGAAVQNAAAAAGTDNQVTGGATNSATGGATNSATGEATNPATGGTTNPTTGESVTNNGATGRKKKGGLKALLGGGGAAGGAGAGGPLGALGAIGLRRRDRFAARDFIA